MIGQVLSHYRIVEKLGAGGMGLVYRARDERLDRDVALKVLPPGKLADEEARKRFRKEARALSRLNHPNIGTIHDFDTQNGTDFLVMEYVPGVSLDEKLALGPLTQKEIARLGMQLADGLTSAHEKGVMHRDLKPGNLRVTPDGRVKILDFGLAELFSPPSDQAVTESEAGIHVAAGTLPYMAPEQLRGEKADPRSDIYAAGVVLYEMATGRRAFPQSHGPLLTDAILHQTPPAPSQVNPKVAPGLDSIVLKALDKDPERRYQAAGELRVDLERLSTAPLPEILLGRPRRAGRPLLWLGAPALSVALLLLLLVGLNVGGWRDRLTIRVRPPPIRALAVLPLENLSHDPEQDYFVDGMTEALTTDLAQISSLQVISRNSAMRFKGSRRPLSEIAGELHVDGLVEGSVLRSGNRVRINAQLIHAATDRHLWAASYERDLRDVLTLQSEVARAITTEIKKTLTAQELSRLSRPRAVHPEAYDAYLRGRFYWNQRSEEGQQKALAFFREAIEKDPAYAQAYAGLADYYILLGGGFLNPQEAMPKAKAAAARALELDESLAEAHASLASVHLLWDWEWRNAEEEYRRSLDLNPNYATAHQWYASYLAAMGRLDEALAEIRRAQALDPLAIVIFVDVVRILHLARRFDQAIEQSRKTIEMDPSFFPAHQRLAQAYEQKQMYAEAIEEFEKAVALSQGSTRVVASLARAYALAGRKDEARKRLQELKMLSAQRYVSPYFIAAIHAALGEKDQAFEWLEKAFQERSERLVYLKVDPLVDNLRADPRFLELVKRVGLPM